MFFRQNKGAYGRRESGLNLHCLKPGALETEIPDDVLRAENEESIEYVQCRARTEQPELQFFPTKFAWFLVENEAERLELPEPNVVGPNQYAYIDHADRHWSTSDLNHILSTCVVPAQDGSHLQVFGCVEWNSTLCEGRSRMLVYTLRTFYGSKRQVRE